MGTNSGLPTQLVEWTTDQLGWNGRCRFSPLGTGVGARTYLVSPTGIPARVRSRRSPDAVLRILPNRSPEFASGVLSREARVLRVLDGAVIAPVVLGVDATGAEAGQPALLTSRLPGRAMTLSKGSDWSWVAMTRKIAGVLVDVHGAIPAGDPAVPSVGFDWLQPTALGVTAEYAPNPWGGFWHELHGLAEETKVAATGFIQRDFRVVHLLWRRLGSQVSGIFGWERAGYGPRGWDLARARLDLTLQCGGSEAADLVAAAYEEAEGEPLGDRRFWDLAVGLSSIDALDSWGRGYAELGRGDLKLQTLQVRLLEFLRHR